MTVKLSSKHLVSTRFSRVQYADISINKLKRLCCSINQIVGLSLNQLANIEVRKMQFYMTVKLSSKHSVSIRVSRVQYADISINKLKPLLCAINQIFELNFEFASIEVREKQFYMTVTISTKYSVSTRFSRVQQAYISINKLKRLFCSINQIVGLSLKKKLLRLGKSNFI